jgi:hypothetical protein
MHVRRRVECGLPGVQCRRMDKPGQPISDLMTVEEAAAYLKISVSTLRFDAVALERPNEAPSPVYQAGREITTVQAQQS